MKSKVIVTSALPYSNGDLHIGHLLEYLQSDSWVRFRKMLADDCYFFCADDTHGTPVMIAAKKLGVTPETLIADKKSVHLKEFKAFGVQFTHYSSTHSHINQKLCTEIYRAMVAANHITKKTIEQSYCSQCEMFLPDRFIKGTCPNCQSQDQYGDVCEACGTTYTPEDLLDPYCSVCQSTPILKSTEHLFFNLNHFNAFLKTWVRQHTSPEVANQFAKWFVDGLKSWNISRDTPYFGFEIPDFPKKYFYVWVDAPIGYIAASAEWGAMEQHPIPFTEHWKNTDNEIVHFIGKDIIYFHSLFWPAMLKCAGYALPSRIFVHGFLTLNGEKMSKSKGTFILARTYLSSGLAPDYLRYYFLSKLNGRIEDVDLNLDDFKNRINSELIGKITNLASRSISMLHKKAGGVLLALSPTGKTLLNTAIEKQDEIMQYYREIKFNLVISTVRELAELANKYFDTQAPWMLPDSEVKQIATITGDVIQLFRVLVIYLTPALPTYSKKARYILGETTEHPYLWKDLNHALPAGHSLNPYEHLAQRVTQETLDTLIVPTT